LKRTDDLAADVRKQTVELKVLSERMATLEGAFAEFTRDIDRMDRNIDGKVELAVMKAMRDNKDE